MGIAYSVINCIHVEQNFVGEIRNRSMSATQKFILDCVSVVLGSGQIVLLKIICISCASNFTFVLLHEQLRVFQLTRFKVCDDKLDNFSN